MFPTTLFWFLQLILEVSTLDALGDITPLTMLAAAGWPLLCEVRQKKLVISEVLAHLLGKNAPAWEQALESFYQNLLRARGQNTNVDVSNLLYLYLSYRSNPDELKKLKAPERIAAGIYAMEFDRLTGEELLRNDKSLKDLFGSDFDEKVDAWWKSAPKATVVTAAAHPLAELKKMDPITIDGITWSDPFDDEELLAKAAEKDASRKELIASRNKAQAQIRAANAVLKSRAISTIPEVTVKFPKAPATIPFMGREIFYRLAGLACDPEAKPQLISYQEETLSSKIYGLGTEQALKEIYSYVQGLREEKARVDKRIADNEPSKAADQIQTQVLSRQIEECVRVSNSWGGASREASFDSIETKLPAKKYEFTCTDSMKGQAYGLIREWRLTVSEDLPTQKQFQETTDMIIKTDVPEKCTRLARFLLKSKAAELASATLNLSSVPQSKLNELGALVIKAEPGFKIVNIYDFAQWPDKIQKILQKSKTTIKGVNSAIAEYQKMLASTVETAFDRAFGTAVLKVASDQLASLLQTAQVSTEAALNWKFKSAIIYSQTDAVKDPKEYLADVISGNEKLDRFKEPLKPSEATISPEQLLSLANKNKKAAKKQQKLKAFATSALVTLWNTVYGVTKTIPAWVNEAALLNESFVGELIQLKVIGDGIAGLKNHRDFKSYTYVTFAAFLEKFYKVVDHNWIEEPNNLEKIKEWLADGTMKRVYDAVDKLTVKDPTTGATTPMMIHNMADLRTQVSRLPTGKQNKPQKSSEDSAKRADQKPTVDSGGYSSGDNINAKERRRAKRAAKRANKTPKLASTSDAGRGRSRTRQTDGNGGNKGSRSRSQRGGSNKPKPSGSKTRSKSGSRSGSKPRAGSKSRNSSKTRSASKQGRNSSRSQSRGRKVETYADAARKNRSNSKSGSPRSSVKGRTFFFDGKQIAADRITAGLAKNPDVKQLSIDGGRFSRGYLEKALGNPDFKFLSTPFGDDGKLRAGWTKSKDGKLQYTGPKSTSPKTARPPAARI